MRAGLEARARRHRALRAELETFDLRRRLAAVRARLQAATAALGGGASRRRLRLEGRLGSAAARLDSLSPLAVLGPRLRRLLERRPHPRAASATSATARRATRVRRSTARDVRVCACDGSVKTRAGRCRSAVRLTAIGTQPIPDPTIKDFEAAIAELETIVKKLEEGDLALEASLQLYERGVQLSRFCHAGSRRPSGASRSSTSAASSGRRRRTSTPTTTRRRAAR